MVCMECRTGALPVSREEGDNEHTSVEEGYKACEQEPTLPTAPATTTGYDFSSFCIFIAFPPHVRFVLICTIWFVWNVGREHSATLQPLAEAGRIT